MRRLLLLVVIALSLVLAAGVVAAEAAPAHAAKRKCVKHGPGKRGKKGRRCAKPKPKPKPKPPARAPQQTPIAIDILDGSALGLDRGDGSPRSLPLTGSLRGYVDGGYQLGRDNTVQITHGTLRVVPTDVITDNCIFPAPARTAWATTIALDEKRSSDNKVVLGRTGMLTANLQTLLRSVLDLRSPAGCAAPPVTSGYADTALPIAVSGQVVKESGLTRVTLDSAPQPLSLDVCLAAGAADQPCPAPATALTGTGTQRLVVHVVVG